MPKGHTGDGFAQVRGKPLDGVQLRRPPCGRRARANPRHAPAHNPAALAWLASGRGAARNMSMHNKTKDTLPSARRPHLNASSGKARHVNAHPSAAGSTNSTIAAVHVIAVTGMRRIPIKFVLRPASRRPVAYS